jgi:hypothetical protein
VEIHYCSEKIEIRSLAGVIPAVNPVHRRI